MNSPKEIIERTLQRWENIYSDELSKIDKIIEKRNYVGGTLNITLNFAFLKELLPIFIEIYKHRGWSYVDMYTMETPTRLVTVIKLKN